MSPARRIIVLVLTLMPLLAAQCWGLCGVPEPVHAHHQQLPPCHKAPTEPTAPKQAPCCTATAAIAISADTDNGISIDPSIAVTPITIDPAIFQPTPIQLKAGLAPPSPPRPQHSVLRI